MTIPSNTLPAEYHSATPYLIIRNSASAIEFYKKVLDATEIMRMTMPDGKVAFAGIKIGDSLILISDECPEMDALSPESLGGSSIRIHLYVDDVDALANKAILAGAIMTRPIQDQFFGDRSGAFIDPYGHIWSVATKKENLTRDELLERFKIFCYNKE